MSFNEDRTGKEDFQGGVCGGAALGNYGTGSKLFSSNREELTFSAGQGSGAWKGSFASV
jgi:hypothetical protein